MLSCSWILAAALAPSVPVPPASLRNLVLRDQHGKTGGLAEHKGRVLVAVVVDARRLRRAKPWEVDLHRLYPEVAFLRIADVPVSPATTHERVAGKLRGRVPDEIAVLIDLERRWARGLQLDTREPNLLLFDGRGRLVAQFRGRREAKLLGEVEAALAPLVEEQRQRAGREP